MAPPQRRDTGCNRSCPGSSLPEAFDPCLRECDALWGLAHQDACKVQRLRDAFGTARRSVPRAGASGPFTNRVNAGESRVVANQSQARFLPVAAPTSVAALTMRATRFGVRSLALNFIRIFIQVHPRQWWKRVS